MCVGSNSIITFPANLERTAVRGDAGWMGWPCTGPRSSSAEQSFPDGGTWRILQPNSAQENSGSAHATSTVPTSSGKLAHKFGFGLSQVNVEGELY